MKRGRSSRHWFSMRLAATSSTNSILMTSSGEALASAMSSTLSGISNGLFLILTLARMSLRTSWRPARGSRAAKVFILARLATKLP